MKNKFFVRLGGFGALLMLSSCYSSTYSVGELDVTDPVVCVRTVHAPHYIEGLVNAHSVEGKDVMGDLKDYKVKHYTTFTDGLLSAVTLGIYTPTTLKFYVPYEKVDSLPDVVRKSSLRPKFGIRAGAGYSSADWGINNTAVDGMNFSVGAILDIPVTKRFYIQPGLFLQRGEWKCKSKYKNSWRDVSSSTTFTTPSLQLPILASLRWDLAESVQLQGEVGPYILYRWNYKVKVKEIREYDKNGEYSYSDEVSLPGSHRLGVGVHAGVGVLYKTHYYLGLSYEKDKTIKSKQANLRWYMTEGNNIKLSIGYNF